MFAYSLVVAWLLLAGTGFAMPAVGDVAVRKNNHAVVNMIAVRQTADTPVPTPANPTAPWVSVDESGNPKTVTPVLTTISGTSTIISGAPYDVTGTVFTKVDSKASVTTSTGIAQATAANANGSGAFALCHTTDDNPLKPFCEPRNNATMYPGSTQYITWDTSYFNSTNTTVRIVGFYTENSTSQAFTSGPVAAGWGFFQWPVTPELITAPPGRLSAVNITLRIAALPLGNAAAIWVPGPTVLVTYPPTPIHTPTPVPTGPALYIGLPSILGFVALMLIGTCLWNRRTRKLGISGSIMGRGRRGYGVGKSRRQRMFGKGSAAKKQAKAEQAILLMEREGRERDAVGGGGGGGGVYRDEPLGGNEAGKSLGPEDRFRRDSDALGSLAGTPTRDRFDLSRPAGDSASGSGVNSNVFREEMKRQEKDRF
ncbi:hypothetical protein B0H67DRAFT_638865 [Lasiosphaeris hirsuta]|uniref:Uncharacterized protein n=1 Tax=Lasiosphaeris hirsuta TaxID=260670 RepID=A0AA40B9S5_9PEZI|nr:hypothetical protein B0H67DRAFT_638865 [Lasiosphaeris hirsuta]